MAVYLSPVGGVAAQFFTNSGSVLTGGKLYTYLAGTTTPAATYTSAAGTTFNPNPIILDAAGRVPNSGEIWLGESVQYKFVLKDSTDVLIGTYDNVTGINSNFVNYNALEEIQTATAGQTVFNLTNSYQPGTNTLSVFVDGVNQYDGSSYSYTETNSTRVTFTQGLHVGALVKFTTAVTLSAGVTASNLVTYQPAGTGAVATTVQAKLRQSVSVMDFGAVGNGTTDDTAAIQAAINSISANGNGTVDFPNGGTYKITSTITVGSRSILFNGNQSTILVGANMTYGINLSGTNCEFHNFSFNKSSGVTVTACIYVTGLQHVFKNITSRNQIWSTFFLGQDLKESHFSEIRVDNDVSGFTGKIFQFDYCVNNTMSDSMLGYCAQAFYGSSTAQPTYGYHNEGLLLTNVITVYAGKAVNFDNGTFIAIDNCLFDFTETQGVFVSNGHSVSVKNSWIASNNTNGFIGVGTLSGVYNAQIHGCTIVRGATAITGTYGVSLSGTNATVIGNAFIAGMNGGIVTDTTSQVIGNTITGGGTNIVATGDNSTIVGNLSVSGTITAGGNQGIFPLAVSGSATFGSNGALPAQVAGYATVNIGGTNYKVPYYNV